MTPIAASSRDTSYFFVLAALVPVVLYCVLVFSQAVNVPIGDDFSILQRLNNQSSQVGSSAWLMEILAAHNEHRIVVTRLLIQLSDALFGNVDFSFLLMLGNLAFVLALIQLGKTLEYDADYALWAIFLCCALLPLYLKLIFYPMANVQFGFGLLFSAIYARLVLDKRGTAWVLAVYILAVLSSGLGLFLILIGGPVLLLRKRWGLLLGHLAVTLATVTVYFKGLGGPKGDKLRFLMEHPEAAASFFLQLLGNLVGDAPAIGDCAGCIGMLLGGILLAFYCWQVLRTLLTLGSGPSDILFRETVVLTLLLLPIALIVLGRAELYSSNLHSASLDGRYRPYGLAFFGVAAISALRQIPLSAKRMTLLRLGVVTLALIATVAVYYLVNDHARSVSERREQGMQSFLSTGDASTLTTFAFPKSKAAEVINAAIAAGIYAPASD